MVFQCTMWLCQIIMDIFHRTFLLVIYIRFNICDVIWETPAYGGAHSAFLDQPFQYVYIHRLILNYAESWKSVFCRSSCVTTSSEAPIRHV